MKYRLCELCGAALDFGERCDCQEEKEKGAELWQQQENTAKKELAACKISA